MEFSLSNQPPGLVRQLMVDSQGTPLPNTIVRVFRWPERSPARVYLTDTLQSNSLATGDVLTDATGTITFYAVRGSELYLAAYRDGVVVGEAFNIYPGVWKGEENSPRPPETIFETVTVTETKTVEVKVRISISAPAPRLLELERPCRALDPDKAASITLTLQSVSACSAESRGQAVQEALVVIGSNAAEVLNNGTPIGHHKNAVSIVAPQRPFSYKTTQTFSFLLPAGWYFGVRQVTGANIKVLSAFDQAIE